ncbi:hypothetical protein Y032_0182g898 [Ancylostoma ceylanicum]|uniref:G-protein coupled receptors family 1 profile domain-containing protein n=2 Tax=Ancylostoma ceylanicum TaxID=53326 RepID=A0A016SSZ4_9BILA|nr:hypothetical protein Y032_0182g898 [Ancylostoma ceylanicum]
MFTFVLLRSDASFFIPPAAADHRPIIIIAFFFRHRTPQLALFFFSECGMRECECLHEPTDGVAGVVNLVMVIGILPALAILGVLLNFLNIVVFASQRNTAAKYLTALSCSDVGVCVAGVVVIFADSLRARAFVVDQLFVFLLPKLIPLGLFFQMLSVYITVLAAFDCFVSVLRGVSSCNSRSTWAPRVLAGVVVTVAAYNVIQFADLEAVECVHPDNYTLYELCPTELRISELYVVVYKGYMYALTMAFIPFLLLTILTIGILYLLRKKQEKAEKVKCEEQEDQGSPVVLLLVIVLFLACNVTSLLVNVFEMLKIHLGPAADAILIDVGNLLVVVNATANFFVYWASSLEYKAAVRGLVRKYITRRKAIDLISTRTNAEFV